MSEYTEEQAKADADALVARLEADPSLRAALTEDPRGTLQAEGLPADTVDELVRALGGEDVAGFGSLALGAQPRATTHHFATVAPIDVRVTSAWCMNDPTYTVSAACQR